MGVSAQTTANLTLQGAVAASTAIEVTPLAAASALDLATTASNLSVATLTYHSNDPDGFVITVDSANNFALINPLAPTYNFVGYTMRLTTTGAVFVETTPIVESTTPAPMEVSGPLFISYTGSNLLSAGTFADTLTFTITNN